MSDPVWQKYLSDALTQVNANKKVCISNASKIQGFVILPRDFSIETGELTATLKLKRDTVLKNFGDAIEKCYSEVEATPSKL